MIIRMASGVDGSGTPIWLGKALGSKCSAFLSAQSIWVLSGDNGYYIGLIGQHKVNWMVEDR